MHIAILAPSHKSFISKFLPDFDINDIPDGINSAPFIGTIIEELLCLNHRITAITLTKAINNDYTTKRFISNNFEWIVIPYRPNSIRFNGNKIGRILDFYKFEIHEIAKCLKSSNPHIVHAHWSYEYAGAALKSGYPHLITIHDNAVKVFYFFKNIYRFCRLLMSEFYLRQSKNISTVSPYMLDYAIQRCKNVRVIPNPTLIFDFDFVKKLIFDKCISLSTARIIMINNGWDKRKNGFKALLAFQLLKMKMPNLSLHLFGEGSETDGFANTEASSIGLQDVYFYGLVPHHELIQELSKSHFLLHPALEESFGVVLIEAMSLGIPAFGGNNSGAVPWVLNNKILEVDVNDPIVISNRMFEFLNNSKLYLDVSLNCYDNVKNRFSTSEIVKQYVSFYDNILNQISFPPCNDK
jgi:glycosyltransferase involved in cell wall biosynthesis